MFTLLEANFVEFEISHLHSLKNNVIFYGLERVSDCGYDIFAVYFFFFLITNFLLRTSRVKLSLSMTGKAVCHYLWKGKT